MPNKAYFEFIRILQEILLFIGVAILIVLPVLLAYFSNYLPKDTYSVLFWLSLATVSFVMAIRPLADLYPNIPWLRPLVILRKGFGVFSASIIVAIMCSRVLSDGLVVYLADFVRPEHWSVVSGAVLAPLGDISALILLITSNKYSKRVLKGNWKRIQKLAYLYFYAGALYEYILLDSLFALVSAITITVLVVAAFLYKRVTPRTALV